MAHRQYLAPAGILSGAPATIFAAIGLFLIVLGIAGVHKFGAPTVARIL
jgi:hypothetical protein